MINKKISICSCILFIVTGCASNDHLLFFTNSSIGVDISVEPNQTPVKFIVGYKRQEGVIDPIGQGYNCTKGEFKNYSSTTKINGLIITKDGYYFYPKEVKDEAHSVIAKMNFGATGGGAAKTSAAQWFATGKAAEKLAENPLTPAAISGDARLSPVAGRNVFFGEPIRTNTIYSLAYQQIAGYTAKDGKNDVEALKIKQAVDDLDDVEFSKEFTMYMLTKDGKDKDKKFFWEEKFPKTDTVNKKSFKNVANYLTELEATINNALEIDSNTVKKTDNTKLSDAEQKVIKENMLTYKERLTKLTDQISKNKDVAKMMMYAIFGSKQIQ